jgi:predicted aldo/keto reductase-like oxidoreductase
MNLTAPVLDGHLEDITTDYNRVVMVNLVKKNKEDEAKLTEMLQQLLQERPRKNVKHIWFDFHGETHGDKFQNIQKLMTSIKTVQDKFGFFVRERFGGKNVI